MEFFINGEKADIELTDENNAAEIVKSMETQLEKGLIIASLSINNRYYSPESPELEAITVDKIENVSMEIATAEEVSFNLINEARTMLDKVINDMRENGFDHVRELNEIFDWVVEAIHIINKTAAYDMAEAHIVISTITQVKDYINNPERQEEKIQALASILGNITQYLESIQIKLSSGYQIDPDDLLNSINETEILLPQISESFQVGNDRDALSQVQKVITVLESCGIYLKSILKDFDEEKRADVEESYNGLNSMLGEMLEAFENGDFVLIGDLLEYELPDRLSSYKNIVFGGELHL